MMVDIEVVIIILQAIGIISVVWVKIGKLEGKVSMLCKWMEALENKIRKE